MANELKTNKCKKENGEPIFPDGGKKFYTIVAVVMFFVVYVELFGGVQSFGRYY